MSGQVSGDGLIEEAWRLLAGELRSLVDLDKSSELSAARTEGGAETRTDFRLYEAEKLSRMVVERYSIRALRGLVVNLYPKPEYPVPLLTFQLGGNPPAKTLCVLDLVPFVPARQPSSSLRSAWEKGWDAGFATIEGAPPWLKEIASPHALVCQYKPLDPDVLLTAVRDYVRIWRDEFYLPAQPDADRTGVEAGILRFKRVLHANDAGLPIYRRSFGAATLNALVDAAFGAAPALGADELSAELAASLAGAGEGAGEPGSMRWDDDAEAYLQQAPIFVRGQIRKKAEERAAQLGLRSVTRALIEKLRQ
jgi:hypothetical protein